ncbi:DUF4382 domain-containing protein [Solemya velum gill symbiont]|uniref:DUF4382 domain-containing protein n=1 Tax=Solemya velum gill symbiont TaxID=2340 RepID=UPI0009CC3C6E|nr:DUF4382 domain-containing protein [Solemya velum gill symbiont]OOY69648.1 hypothetical protein BOW07_07985 [Solemya velum gill symbiont]
MRNGLKVTLLMVFTALTASCGGGGGGGGGTATPTGLTLRITDAPVDDLCEVHVKFTEVILEPADGGTSGKVCYVPTGTVPSFPACLNSNEATVIETAALPQQIELTSLDQGSSVALLDQETLPPGEYSQIKLLISEDADTFVIRNTAPSCEVQHGENLRIPSSLQTGLKLNVDFTLAANSLVDFTIDFDLGKSIKYFKNSDSYQMNPTATIIDTLIADTQFDGTVTDSQTTPETPIDPATCKVYVYQGSPAQPDDNCVISEDSLDPTACDLIGDQPYKSADLIGSVSPYNFTTGYMEDGDYTVLLACGEDNTDLDDDLTFINPSVSINPITAAPGLKYGRFRYCGSHALMCRPI